ncbi:rhamnogalacturonan lyase [Asticcacaulis sp. ZE23SCel15]|uniref:rhamnogalacturonan lyase n=1 Tax=Asticcacaulis sp. ZE23SCel15 TaxID=3059027 RepID=UPI00265DC984|nr:rhamnogalacturonan lyase [Asticcacaulis sp. ZE23SCel15]WKL57947.1 rhamnogalacturonan lyase [Asticcacaulis sp. ZE23SCel15]
MHDLKLYLRRSGAILPTLAALAMSTAALAQTGPRHMEAIDRGVVAVPATNGVLVSWRLLGNDADKTTFNLYRDGKKITPKPISATNFADAKGSATSIYKVAAITGGKATGTSADARVWADGYLNIPLNKPADGTTPDGQTYSYNANDASAGDLDGDGRYEIILKWDPSNSKDNSQGGYTGNVFIDAYTLDGKQLWRIDLGRNIRAGAHYTQFQVADYDGDGKAEIILKTADGSKDAQGKVIGDANANWVEGDGEVAQNDRTGSVVAPDGKLMAQFKGRILKGPEYLSVFEGATGRVLDTVDFANTRGTTGPDATPEEQKARWGDAYGNRSERYLAGTAWLDGVHPSVVMARGYYARTTLSAYDFRDGKLTRRWYFDSEADGAPDGYSHQGNHQFSVADVDGDGKDEVIYGSMTLDNDGKPLWSAKLGHGDAMHVSDLDPTRPGLEKFGVHESMRDSGNRGSAMLDAKTGEMLWSTPAEKDTGRGVSADIDPRHLGAESWASNSSNLYNAKGEIISDKRPRSMNFAIWWDGDLTRELLDGNKIFKWDWKTGDSPVIFEMTDTTSNNGTKSNPALQADILGDWREEVIMRTTDNTALRIYSTNIPTTYSFTTLMHDPVYRAAVAWQNTAYNQPPHVSYYLGEGMKTPPKANIKIGK